MSDAQMDSMQDDMFDVGIHELGHAGQKVFDLPQGGNTSMFSEGAFLPEGHFEFRF